MASPIRNPEEGDWRHRMRDPEEGASISHREEVYTIGASQTSQIYDEGNKWIFYNPSSGLMASPKRNLDEETRFVITSYYQESSNTDKVPVTLKIDGTNLYLSCSNGELILEGPENDETLDTIQGSIKRFLFLRARVKGVTFESVMYLGMFICTDKINAPSPVNMSKLEDPKKIFRFTIDGQFSSVGEVLL